MRPSNLLHVQPIRFRPFRDGEALARANGENLEAQRATSWAWTLAAFVALLAMARVLVGCADTAALGVAARTAQGVACAVCGTAQPDVREQAAALSRSIAQLTEAIAVLAAAKDSTGTAVLLEQLRAREAEQRADFEQLVELASKALPPPPAPPAPPATSSASPAPPPSPSPAATP